MAHEINFDSDGNIVLRINWKATLKVFIILALAVGAGFLPLEGMTLGARICLMIFVGAAGLWVTEAIPPFATAIMVIVLSVYLLGTPGGPLGLEPSGVERSYQIFLNPIASPVLVLFFGGFILAVAATKHGLDVRLARAFVKPFGTHPKMVLLGVICITALFSMFMSNTATAAMMIAILTPLFKHFEGRDPFKKALVLAVPFAANIGGMGTLIGTPPNAVAASVLGQLGHPVSFLKWMVIAMPIVIIMLLVLWYLLIKIFKPRTDHFEMLFPENLKITWDLVIVVATFSVTVFLWLTEPLLKIPSAVVALLPIMVFTMFGIINREDLRKIEWHVLILVAGGLALGVAMKQSGLSDLIVGYIKFMKLPPSGLLVTVAIFAVFVSNFMSNTAAANLMIPIVTSLAVVSPGLGAVVVALACSLSMSLPISTPPNAIAFATQAIETKDMARYGTLVSAFGIVVMLGILYLFRGLLD
ncbi:MAG: DASS family sodium-coupled anion symporter [Candidatus Zixiibacteriota bacterium]